MLSTKSNSCSRVNPKMNGEMLSNIEKGLSHLLWTQIDKSGVKNRVMMSKYIFENPEEHYVCLIVTDNMHYNWCKVNNKSLIPLNEFIEILEQNKLSLSWEKYRLQSEKEEKEEKKAFTLDLAKTDLNSSLNNNAKLAQQVKNDRREEERANAKIARHLARKLRRNDDKAQEEQIKANAALAKSIAQNNYT